MGKKKGRKKNTKARQVIVQNRAGMLAIGGVVCMLLVILLFEGASLRDKREMNREKITQLEKQLKEEEARTGEIEELQEYMQSDEYIEKTAKEKIGLVKDNEIIFKENK